MRTLLLFLVRWLETTLRPRVALQLEVVALRHQLAVYQRTYLPAATHHAV